MEKKTSETIYFNGSLCDVHKNCKATELYQKMEGGWSINSSLHHIKAFGTFTGRFAFCFKTDFSMELTGKTHK